MVALVLRLDVIWSADWVIDLGPEAGDDGGRGVDVAFAGLRTVQVVACVRGDDRDRAGVDR